MKCVLTIRQFDNLDGINSRTTILRGTFSIQYQASSIQYHALSIRIHRFRKTLLRFPHE